MKINCNSRFCAFAIHFACSLLVFSIFLYVLLKLWYPSPFFSASGGWQGIRIVALVDLVIGPLLTLVVYKPTKPAKELRTDISIIVLFQLLALGWGIYTVYNQRPVAAVFWEDRFYTVPATALESQGISLDRLRQFSKTTPAYIFVERPATREGWDRVVDRAQNQNIPPHHQIELYRPLRDHLEEVYRYNLDIEDIIQNNPEMKTQIQAILDETGTQLADNRYIGLESRYRNIVLVFNNDHLIGSAAVPQEDTD